jgi:hypothetical protein
VQAVLQHGEEESMRERLIIHPCGTKGLMDEMFDYPPMRVRNITNLLPSDDYFESLWTCGLELSSICTDEHLTYEQVRYLASRLRCADGVDDAPTGHHISMWLDREGGHVAIGFDTYTLKYGDQRDMAEFNQYVDIALQETFE